jgi:hypothetical protein
VCGPMNWESWSCRAGRFKTGFDRKSVTLSHNSDVPVQVTIEVDPTHSDWFSYRTIIVPPGKAATHVFPAGYSAHWVRVTADRDCVMTAEFVYE